MEGSKALEVADEVEMFVTPSIISLQGLTTTQCYAQHRRSVMRSIDGKVKQWASWSFPKSAFFQGQIKDGIEKLQKEIDDAMMKFQVCEALCLEWQYISNLHT